MLNQHPKFPHHYPKKKKKERKINPKKGKGRK